MRLIPVTLPAGSRQIGNEPAPEWIASGRHDDRNGRTGLLGRKRCESPVCRNDINLETDQVRCKSRQPFKPIFRIAALENNSAAV